MATDKASLQAELDSLNADIDPKWKLAVSNLSQVNETMKNAKILEDAGDMQSATALREQAKALNDSVGASLAELRSKVDRRDEIKKQLETATTEEETTQQNKDYVNKGGADEDSGSVSSSSSSSKAGTSGSSQTVSSSVGKNKSPTMGLGQGVPGKRPYNPLSQFSSYNYQISLYMVTPKALNLFTANGRRAMEISKDGSSGFYLIAQSGGKNWKNNDIAPGFELDLGIDNVVIEQSLAGQATGSPVAGTTVAMSITEPNSIGMATRLQEASEAMKGTLTDKERSELGIYNFFMLGIRFYGYDANGELVSGTNYAESDASRIDKNAIFERYFQLRMTEFKSKLSSGTAVHNLKFSVLSEVGKSDKLGRIPFTTSVNASTVAGALSMLMRELNKQEEKLVQQKAVEIANIYEVEYEKGSLIPTSKLVNPKADKDKSRGSPSTVKDSKSSNDAASQKAAPDVGTKQFSIKGDISIIQQIEKFITESSYVKDAIASMPTSNIDSSEQQDDVIENKNPTKLKWFAITPVIQVLGDKKDAKRNDWAYKITYHISEYEIPYLVSEYVKATTEFGGAYKKYNYFYTGKNTEVLSYEQQLDVGYFVMSTVGGPGSNPDLTIPVVHNRRAAMESTGALDKGAEAVNSIKTSLYEMASFATAKISIMGDPDYLAQPNQGITSVDPKSLYGQDGYSFAGTNGQAFVEIKFGDVTDYSTSDGLLKLNPSISLVPQVIKSNDKFKQRNAKAGMFYTINTVRSTFNGGAFKQELSLVYAPIKPKEEETRASESDSTRSIAKPKNTNVDKTKICTPASADDDSNPAKKAINQFNNKTIDNPTFFNMREEKQTSPFKQGVIRFNKK